jgi:hypothetical protein
LGPSIGGRRNKPPASFDQDDGLALSTAASLDLRERLVEALLEAFCVRGLGGGGHQASVVLTHQLISQFGAELLNDRHAQGAFPRRYRDT